jgi:hypothetical protein
VFFLILLIFTQPDILCQYYTTFYSCNLQFVQIVFIPDKPFHPTLMFSWVRPRAYPRGEHLKGKMARLLLPVLVLKILRPYFLLCVICLRGHQIHGCMLPCSVQPSKPTYLLQSCVTAGNTEWGSITVPLISYLTRLDFSVLQKIVSYHTTNSKPVEQEVNSTVILPPLILPGYSFKFLVTGVNS